MSESVAEEEPQCALCGSTVGVGWFSPDMDIAPVLLCRLCLFSMLSPKEA